jgi:hypothetical protein
MAHGMDRYKVSMTIPLNPAKSWMGTVIGTELDDIVE